MKIGNLYKIIVIAPKWRTFRARSSVFFSFIRTGEWICSYSIDQTGLGYSENNIVNKTNFWEAEHGLLLLSINLAAPYRTVCNFLYYDKIIAVDLLNCTFDEVFKTFGT